MESILKFVVVSVGIYGVIKLFEEEKDTILYDGYIDGIPRYVGITKVDRLTQRFKEHKISGKDFDSLERVGRKRYTRSDAESTEEKRIKKLKEMGYDLLNIQHNSNRK